MISSLTDLVLPAVSELRKLASSNFGATAGGIKNPKPAARYLQPGRVTFAGLISTIDQYLPKLDRRIGIWERAIPTIESEDWFATQLSIRPIPEILVEALLRSCKPTLSGQPNTDHQAVNNWFGMSGIQVLEAKGFVATDAYASPVTSLEVKPTADEPLQRQ